MIWISPAPWLPPNRLAQDLKAPTIRVSRASQWWTPRHPTGFIGFQRCPFLQGPADAQQNPAKPPQISQTYETPLRSFDSDWVGLCREASSSSSSTSIMLCSRVFPTSTSLRTKYTLTSLQNISRQDDLMESNGCM